jgi:uncharacterized protein YndB with AHSA1/START domain
MSPTKFSFPSDREIVMERVFDAPVKLVFKACMDPTIIPQWWGPRLYTTIIDEDDVKPAGTWRYISRDSEGNDYAFNGVYCKIVLNKRVVRTLNSNPCLVMYLLKQRLLMSRTTGQG